METTKLFMNGRSQAVRLSQKYRFKGSSVAIKPVGNGLLLLPITNIGQMLQEAVDSFEPNVKLERGEQTEQLREFERIPALRLENWG